MTKEVQAIQRIQTQLAQMGPVLPGSLSEQWNVCGTPGCRCKASSNPKKHGPYYQLSFTVAGKSSTLFVQKEDLGEVRQRLKRYQAFKRLTTAWVQACLALARKQGFRGAAT
ncbi:MAG: DUF6788 family protein [Nitrospirales bacterium]|nr:hypothetical protein [Nitrospirales bacterium]